MDTPEEIRETLFRTLDKLDELYGDRSSYEEVRRKEREAHDLEVSNLKAEMASKDRSLAEKDSTIAEKDVRIAALEKELADTARSACRYYSPAALLLPATINLNA